MQRPIEPSVIHILNAKGKTIGTGFLVSAKLAVTCAHVILNASIDSENHVRVQFMGKKQIILAKVPEEYQDFDRDVAIIELPFAQQDISFLKLAPAASCRPLSDFRSFGYATAARVQGIHANGKIDGYLTEPKYPLLQLQSAQAHHGISGAPVLDEVRDVIVGMITKGHDELGRNEYTTFATPSETIWQVCPQLKPPASKRNQLIEGIEQLPYDYAQRIQNFLDEYLGRADHPVPFGGRDNFFRTLHDWLTETMSRLLLAAPAGRGKSALLVRWLDELKEREDIALAFVPVSVRFNTSMERIFYAALAARLAFLHGDDVPASPETSTAVYRGLVSDYLSKPLANGRTLLVVLDGLDEAADWQAGADFLPTTLPAGVRVVVSARGEAAQWHTALNWGQARAAAPFLAPLDQAGLADVLLKMGCPLDDLSRDVNIITELYRLSEGDPLLVGLYVKDLWAKGEKVARLNPKDLASIQPGYRGYFDGWWKDQKKLWGNSKPWLEEHIWKVLNLLAGALGPLFKNDIQALAPELKSNYITDALDVLQRFIIGDNRLQGYTFSHPKLTEFFWEDPERLTTPDRAEIESCFLDWCKRIFQDLINSKQDTKKKTEVPVYVLRNYSAHLARAKRPIEEWLSLVQHQKWAQIWFTVEGAYGGYLQDVQRVWEQAKTLDRKAMETQSNAPYLGVQIRCGLIEASLHSLAGKIPTELVSALVRSGFWTLPQAWASIRQIPDPDQQTTVIRGLLIDLPVEQLREAPANVWAIQDEWNRALVLSSLAQRLPVDDLGQVLVAARAIHNEKSRAKVLSTLAQSMPNVAGEAVATARAIQDEERRADVLSYLTESLPVDDLGQVLVAARAIENEEHRAWVLCALVQRLSEDELDELLAAVRTIKHEEHRAEVLSALAQRLPERKLDEVLTTARAIKHKEHRTAVLSTLAQRMPDVAGEVLAVVRDIWDEEHRAKVLESLAQCLPERKLDKLLVATQTIRDEEYRAAVLSAIAQRLPKGKLDRLLITARTILNEEYRIVVLNILAQRMPENQLDQLLFIAQTIWDQEYRVRALSALAQRMSESQLDELLAVARALPDEEYCVRLLSGLAEHLPMDKLDRVLAAALDIEDERNRAKVLSDLAERLSVSKLGQVLAATLNIEDEKDRTQVLCALVQRLSEDELDELLAAVRTIKHEEHRAAVLIVLAQRMPEVAGEALLLSRTIRDEEYLVRVLSALAQCMPEADREALVAAQAIQDEDARARVLKDLAQRLPQVAGEALAAARAIQDEEHHARVLRDLMQHLPNTMEEALATAQAIRDKEYKIRVLSALAQHLPDVAGESLTAARTIQDKWFRAWVFHDLVQPLKKLNKALSYSLIEISLNQLSLHTRADLFSDISALLPVLLHLGVRGLEREIYEAVREVSDWWP